MPSILHLDGGRSYPRHTPADIATERPIRVVSDSYRLGATSFATYGALALVPTPIRVMTELDLALALVARAASYPALALVGLPRPEPRPRILRASYRVAHRVPEAMAETARGRVIAILRALRESA